MPFLDILCIYLSFSQTPEQTTGLFKEVTHWVLMNNNCPVDMFAVNYLNLYREIAHV